MQDKIRHDIHEDDEEGGKGGQGKEGIKKELFILPNEKQKALVEGQTALTQGYDPDNRTFAKKFSEALDNILSKIYLLRSKQLKAIVGVLLNRGVISTATSKADLKKLFKVLSNHLGEFEFMNKQIKDSLIEKRIQAKTEQLVNNYNKEVSKEDANKTITLDSTTPRSRR